METVFDHDITDAEWEFIKGIDKEQYLKIVPQKAAWRDIAAMYYHRGNEEMAEKYINMTMDIDMINSFWRIVMHE
jgi:hypothetical protein